MFLSEPRESDIPRFAEEHFPIFSGSQLSNLLKYNAEILWFVKSNVIGNIRYLPFGILQEFDSLLLLFILNGRICSFLGR